MSDKTNTIAMIVFSIVTTFTLTVMLMGAKQPKSKIIHCGDLVIAVVDDDTITYLSPYYKKVVEID